MRLQIGFSFFLFVDYHLLEKSLYVQPAPVNMLLWSPRKSYPDFYYWVTDDDDDLEFLDGVSDKKL